jgi:hypothetical protein
MAAALPATPCARVGALSDGAVESVWQHVVKDAAQPARREARARPAALCCRLAEQRPAAAGPAGRRRACCVSRSRAQLRCDVPCGESRIAGGSSSRGAAAGSGAAAGRGGASRPGSAASPGSAAGASRSSCSDALRLPPSSRRRSVTASPTASAACARRMQW